MLGHSRKKIRDSLLSALTGITSVGGRVESGIIDPIVGLPNIAYYLDTEDLDQAGSFFVTDDNPSERSIRIIIEARAETVDGSDVPIDDLCLEIEKSVATASTLNDWCKDLTLQSTTIDLDEYEIPIALATLEYNGYYSEPKSVVLSDVSYTKTQTSISVSFKTSVRGLATVDAFDFVGQTHTYSSQEAEMSYSHNIDVTGLTAGTTYVMYYSFVSGAYGYDITPFTTTMYDGVTSPVQTTLP